MVCLSPTTVRGAGSGTTSAGAERYDAFRDPLRRALALALLGSAPLLAIGRDLIATMTWPDNISTAAGYGALLALAAVLAWRLGLDAPALGLRHGRLLLRVFGAALLTAVLAAPALRHGAAPGRVGAALLPSLAVALIEETLYRGVLLAIISRSFGAVPAVVLTSVAFALAHLAAHPWPTFVLGIFVGAVLAAWRLVADDLIAPIAAHALADALAASALAG